MRRAGLALGVVLLAWLSMLVGCGDGGDDSADPRSPETASGEFAGTIRLGAALSETGSTRSRERTPGRATTPG